MAKSNKRNKYKKTNVKIHPISFLVGALILAAIVVSIVLAVPSASKRIADDYATAATTLGVTQTQVLDKDNKLKKVSIDKAINNAKKDHTAVIYIGGLWESSAVQWIGAIDDEFRKNLSQNDDKPLILSDHIKNIYYVETKDAEQATEFFKKVEEAFEAKLPASKRGMPLVLTFVTGTLNSNINNQNGSNYRVKAKELFLGLLTKIVV